MGKKNIKFRATVIHEAAKVVQARFGRWGVQSAVGSDLAWYVLLDLPSAIKEASMHFSIRKATIYRLYLSYTLVESGYLHTRAPRTHTITSAALICGRLQIFHLE